MGTLLVIVFKEHPVSSLVPIASILIFGLVVDQHLVAIPDNEPIEDVDLVVPNVVMDIPLRRSERARKPVISDDYIVYLQEHEYDVGDVLNPTTYREAIISPQSNFWIDAIKGEMTSTSQNNVWSLVDFLDGCRPIGYKLVFKTKHDAMGQVERYKARLVVEGYSQWEGIDFKKTFSPVSTKVSLHIIWIYWLILTWSCVR